MEKNNKMIENDVQILGAKTSHHVLVCNFSSFRIR